jgi:hypothetical protein
LEQSLHRVVTFTTWTIHQRLQIHSHRKQQLLGSYNPVSIKQKEPAQAFRRSCEQWLKRETFDSPPQ